VTPGQAALSAGFTAPTAATVSITPTADLTSAVYDNGDVDTDTDDKIILTFSKPITNISTENNYSVVYAVHGRCVDGIEGTEKITLVANEDYTISSEGGTVVINIISSGNAKICGGYTDVTDDLKIEVLNTGQLVPIINPSKASLIVDDAGAQVSAVN
jgi:hypothetical protein